MEFQPVPTKDQILEKMNGLRTYFNVQRNKVVSSKQSDTTTDAVYKPKWQFYESLSFLQDMVTPRRTYSNLDDDEETFPLRINGPRRKKTVPETPAHEMMKEATSGEEHFTESIFITRDTSSASSTTSKSGNEHFGETVAKLMSEVPDGMSKDLLKLEIQQLIDQTKHNSSYSGRSNFNYPPFSVYSSQPCGNSSYGNSYNNVSSASPYNASSASPYNASSASPYNASSASSYNAATTSHASSSVPMTNIYESPVYHQN